MALVNRDFEAYLDAMNEITILLPIAFREAVSDIFTLTNEVVDLPLDVVNTEEIESGFRLACKFDGEYEFGTDYVVRGSNGLKTDVQMGAVVRTAEFDAKFFYDGNDLGSSCKNGSTTFKVWAPTAVQVKVKLFPPGGKYFELIKMSRGEKGVWSIELDRDLELYRYTYMILVDQVWREAVDPYAVAAAPNTTHGVVAKLENTIVDRVSLPPFTHPVDSIIYEAHVRDFTIHPESGAVHKGLYIGACEVDTAGSDGKPTGLSYLKELGITHVEFLPFNDFAGINELGEQKEYNWGYNPLLFNVPEGSYSTDPSNPYKRITELKQMIEGFHSEGLRIIMDVVYNHVYIREQSSFEKIVPGYYFRYHSDGKPSDGTGVGNDIASERLMARKYIHDSVRFWVEEYNIDGIRMDLMGIHDVETVTGIRSLCETLKPGMVIIGEGWDLNTPLPASEKANQRNQHKLANIGQFNDQFRDSIKGSTFNLYERGYALGNGTYTYQAKEVLAGSIGHFNGGKGLFTEPIQSVNYVEAHDNHTLWDKLEACLDGSGELLKMKCHRFATSLVLLAQGIPFLHSGQEFFRTKNGIGNSYKEPDEVNQLDWERKVRYSDNIRYIKGIVEIRKQLDCFRLRSAAEINANMKDLGLQHPLIGFRYSSAKGMDAILIMNPTVFIHHIPLPDGEWNVLADDLQAGIAPLRTIGQGGNAVLEPVSLMVLVKK
ncbi:type I pullulanase [Bacillus sp. FJAT-27225]|uniref:type I pullulanase n=1 Tax=Bacillus sp. FJAT-27225 TaxID=1743144 RepID=UPI00080C2C34|nr:type I pullulanase [Bacillus sp. FJAT-27225]OCA91424.1 type I pullulanase [Bacillus sp. FJAT-27225]